VAEQKSNGKSSSRSKGGLLESGGNELGEEFQHLLSALAD
jgi:hypothetical protein